MNAQPFVPPFDFGEHVLGPWSAGYAGDTAWTVLMGVLVAVACGWLGCYLILQGMALIGDAISHTVLLGIVVAFLITGQTSGVAMFIGAAITGLVTTVLIEKLHTSSRIKEDAAIGIVFTSLFALGVVLLTTFAGNVHLDTHHVLYGNISSAALERMTIGGITILPGICRMALVVTGLLFVIVLFFKELQLVAFDPQLASVMGLHPRAFRYGLMGLLSLTVVSCFEAVGAILVVAMLIAPAATAYLLTTRLPAMFAISAGAGAVSALVGFHIAYWLAVSVGGSIVCTSCGLFGLAFLFSPQQGVLATAVRRLRLRWRMQQENIVRALLRLRGTDLQTPVGRPRLLDVLHLSHLDLWWTVWLLQRRGWIERPAAAEGLRLTTQGAAEALRLDRAHRLWETFLVDQVGIASDHVHPMAEEVEHLLNEQLVESVDDLLGHPDTDPHGTPIPRSPYADRGRGVYTLSNLRVGDKAHVTGIAETHRADPSRSQPPSAPGVAIAALGLPLGQPFEVVARSATDPTWTIEFPDGRRVEIPHHVADAVLVRPEQSA